MAKQFTLTHRPKKISEVIGQKPVKLAISNLLKIFQASGDFPRSLILQGSHGCGKTTIGRILARYLNCEQGPLRACMECASCRGLENGTNPDVYEADAASNRGIDDIRQIQEWCNFKARGRKKLVILDEAHALTPQAWQALLKIVEEGSENVCFVFCTTEAKKIPGTIQSRSMILKINTLTNGELLELADKVIKAEGLTVENPESLNLLVSKSSGHARDFVKLLDEAAHLYSETSGTITDEAIFSMCEMGKIEDAMKFLRSALLKDEKGVAEALVLGSKDSLGFCNSVLEMLRKELNQRAQYAPGIPEIKDVKVVDLVKFLALLEDTYTRVKMGESLATLFIAWERWKNGN